MKVSIIIPVYNEYATFEELINKVLDVQLYKMHSQEPDAYNPYTSIEKEIIVVESNSTDGTRDLVKEYVNNKMITAIYQSKPKGKGNAVKEGLNKATGDIIIIQDADLEYKPEEYNKLIQPIIKGEADFVLGSRHLGKGHWNIRQMNKRRFYAKFVNIGSEIMVTYFNLLYGMRLTDPMTMFKVFRKECIEDIQFRCNYFDLDWEIIIKLIKKGYIPLEVPVSYNSRTVKEGKKIRLIRDGLLNMWAITRMRI